MSEPGDYAQEAAFDAFIDELKRDREFIEQAFEEVSVDNIRSYLGKYGDAIQERVHQCHQQAVELDKLNYYGPSITLSASAIEIIIRFFLLRPLVQGAFLSDEWSLILAKRIATGRTAEDRELLPAMLKQWGIDITSYKLSSNKGLWETFLTVVRIKRDTFVHKGEEVSPEESAIGIECASVFLKAVVQEIAKKFDFTLEKTGKWCEIKGRYIKKSFNPENPF